jgi:hypothetical protein
MPASMTEFASIVQLAATPLEREDTCGSQTSGGHHARLERPRGGSGDVAVRVISV